jgi:hypothetical protein
MTIFLKKADFPEIEKKDLILRAFVIRIPNNLTKDDKNGRVFLPKLCWVPRNI